MPIDKESLKARKWPLPAKAWGNELVTKDGGCRVMFTPGVKQELVPREGLEYAQLHHPDDYIDSCYVREGKVAVFPLPLPPGECGITSLVSGSDGKIFGSTAGGRCHLFAYGDSEDPAGAVASLGVVEEECLTSSLVISAAGRLFLGTRPASGEGHIYACKPGSARAEIDRVCSPVRGEGVSALAIHPDSSRIYGLSSVSGTFFVFDVESGKVELKGAVGDPDLFSHVLLAAPGGDVYGGCRWTELFKYDPGEDRVTRLGIKAPSICGREMYSRIDSLVWHEGSGSVYGGTSGDGILFRFIPGEGRVLSLGKPLNQPRIRCLAVDKDDCVYGVAGKGCCHLFRYDPSEGDLRDLGIVHVYSPRSWHAYEFDAAVAGHDGRIFLGQNERVSMLCSYLPSG